MQFIFFCNPQKPLVSICLMEVLKSTAIKKIVFITYMKKILKVAAFVIFPTSIMVLFEIHQRFEGHFLHKSCVSFKEL